MTNPLSHHAPLFSDWLVHKEGAQGRSHTGEFCRGSHRKVSHKGLHTVGSKVMQAVETNLSILSYKAKVKALFHQEIGNH